MSTEENQFSAPDMATSYNDGYRAAVRYLFKHFTAKGSLEAANEINNLFPQEFPQSPDYFLEDYEPGFTYYKDGQPIYKFIETCRACPEQYDVLDLNGGQVAYVRLRFGLLRVDVPDVGGETIYLKIFPDEYKGTFANEEERVKYLTEISEVIGNHYSK